MAFIAIALVPAIFQHTMETLLRGTVMIVIYTDDVLVAERKEEDH